MARKIDIYVEVALESNMRPNKDKTQIGTRNKDMKKEEVRKKWVRENLGKKKPDGNEVGRNNILLGELVNIDAATAPGVEYRKDKITRKEKRTIANIARLKGITTRTKCLIL